VATKTYGQMCPMARSLDVLGERWTMLVVRELLLGPKRFKHLLAALPAMGPNRLSGRLRGLEESGVVRRVVSRDPGGVDVYELTTYGERLRIPLIALGLWGLELPIDERIDRESTRADLVALSLTATQTHALDATRRDIYEFEVGTETLHFRLREGWFIARSGPSSTDPDLRVTCDLDTFLALALRQTTPAQEQRERRLSIHIGDIAALSELFDVLVYTA